MKNTSINGWLFCVFTSFLLAASASAALFGADTRELITPASPLAELARSTAVGILNTLSTPSTAGHIDIQLDGVGQFMCRDERFANQSSLQFACSGFLVAPDLIVTAGHCMVNFGETSHNADDYCQAYNWLFDYQIRAGGTAQVRGIDADKLYKCKEVIYAVNEDHAPFRDFALVRLDRPVLGRTPFKIAADSVSLNDGVAMIGYPLGMPEIYSGAGRVIVNNSTNNAFVTNLNAFEGNSGSVVFNAKNEVVGILISGTPSSAFVEDKPKKCSRYNHCDVDATKCEIMDNDAATMPNFQHYGSDVERITGVADLIRSLPVTPLPAPPAP